MYRSLSTTHSGNVRTYLSTSLFILLPRLGVGVSGEIFEVGGRDMTLEFGPGVTFAGWQGLGSLVQFRVYGLGNF